MKPAERDHIFSQMSKLCQSLISEAEVLCELIDYINDVNSVGKRISALEDEADNIMHNIGFYYREGKLFDDREAASILDIVNAIEKCTDLIDDIAQSFIRLNIDEVKDNIFSSFMSSGTGAMKMAETVNTIHHMNKANSPMRDIIDLDYFKIEYQRIYDINTKKLYTNGNDPLDVLRWTAIYDAFKKLFEGYESVAEACAKYCILMD